MNVLDTNVIDAALRSSRGASHLLLRKALLGELLVMSSPSLFLEYEDVTSRPSHLAKYSLSRYQVGEVLDGLASVIKPVHIHYLWRPHLQDPKDDLVLECAVNGMAKRIITFNLKDFKGADKFGIEIIRPGDFFKRYLQ